MSNLENEQLFERAAECISYFENKLPAELIQQDLDHDDLDSLYRHVVQAEAQMAQLEFNATGDIY